MDGITALGRAARRRGKGFTLIELMVVLAIIGLSVGLMLPLFSPGTGRAELKVVARELAAELRAVRSSAIAGAREAVLIVDLEARAYGPEGGVLAGRLPRDIEVTVLSAEGELLGDERVGIRFFPNGTSTGGAITLAGSRGGLEITVDWITGRIAVDEPRT